MMPLTGAGPRREAGPTEVVMEFIVVRYVRKRKVFIDGEETGTAGERLRVEEGTHTINLGDPRDYTPKWRRPTVTGTTSIRPMEIAFEEA
jgi:hypothetical protein